MEFTKLVLLLVLAVSDVRVLGDHRRLTEVLKGQHGLRAYIDTKGAVVMLRRRIGLALTDDVTFKMEKIDEKEPIGNTSRANRVLRDMAFDVTGRNDSDVIPHSSPPVTASSVTFSGKLGATERSPKITLTVYALKTNGSMTDEPLIPLADGQFVFRFAIADWDYAQPTNVLDVDFKFDLPSKMVISRPDPAGGLFRLGMNETSVDFMKTAYCDGKKMADVTQSHNESTITVRIQSGACSSLVEYEAVINVEYPQMATWSSLVTPNARSTAATRVTTAMFGSTFVLLATAIAAAVDVV